MAKSEYRNKPYEVEWMVPNTIRLDNWDTPIKTTVILDDQQEADTMDNYLAELFGQGMVVAAFGGPNNIEIQ